MNQAGISIYFIDHSKFITGQCKKILSKANKSEIMCFEFDSKTSLENIYSWINFNMSISVPPIGKHDDFIIIGYCIFKLHKPSITFFYGKYL